MQRLRNHPSGPPQPRLIYRSVLQTHCHLHLLQHLHVVVDLEGVIKVEEVFHLVVGDRAVDHGLLRGADDDEWELDGGVGGRGPRYLLQLTVPLN